MLRQLRVASHTHEWIRWFTLMAHAEYCRRGHCRRSRHMLATERPPIRDATFAIALRHERNGRHNMATSLSHLVATPPLPATPASH